MLGSDPTFHLRCPADMLPLFATLPAVFPPGQRYRYADANYIQLGVLVEHLTGQPFGQYARRAVLDPPGMT